MLRSHSFPSERAPWLRSHYWCICSHRCFTVFLPHSPVSKHCCFICFCLSRGSWDGVGVIYGGCFTAVTRCREWKGEWWERNAPWECLFWSSFLRGAAVRLLACGDKPSDPHRSPSLPPPLLWLSAIRRSSCNWMTIFLSRSFQKIARGWKCVWCGR